MRIVYFGTPTDAVAPLRALIDADHDVAMVVTQPDRRRGRNGAPVASPVKAFALERGLNVVTPVRAAEIVETVRSLEADLGVVVAFGQILPLALLNAARLGCINVHFSLLPRWRGAAPVERAILAGDAETGVAIMAMEEGLDTGAVYAERRVAISDAMTSGGLRDELVTVGSALLVATIPTLATTVPTPQSGEATYAAKLTVEEFRLDPTDPVTVSQRKVRAGNPKPGAWFLVNGARVKVWSAHVAGAPAGPVGVLDAHGGLSCVDGSLVLDEVQPEGKRPMSARAWLAGVRGEVTVDV